MLRVQTLVMVSRFCGVPHVEQEMLILPEHMSSTPGFSGIRVAQSLIFCVMVYISLFVL
jgi:hypothetical protein